MALGLSHDRPVDLAEKPLPSVGAVIATTFAALIVGAASSTLLHDESVAAAWAVAALIGAVLAISTRTLSSRPVTRPALLVWVAVTLGMLGYLLLLGVLSIPRVRNLSHGLLGITVAVAGACVIPAAIIMSTIGRRIPVPRDSSAPLFVKGALGACTAIVWLIAMLWLMPVTTGLSPAPRLAVLLTAAVGIPIVCIAPWTYAYDRVISRWAIAQPAPLVRALDVLASRTGFRFDRVVCLPMSYGAGRVCEVVHRVGGSTLAISESVATELEPEALVAVLAHEAAHIQLHHHRQKIGLGALGSFTFIGSAMVVQMLLDESVPPIVAFSVGVLPFMLGGNLLSQLYSKWVIRRHEAEADAAAVAVSNADALCDGLDMLGAGPSAASVHQRWTTHGTREERMARIRAAASRHP